jgi:hypothetical protein
MAYPPLRHNVRADIRPVCLCGIQLNDGDQRQGQITHPPEQTVEGSLVYHGARQSRITVGLQGDGQALKPVSPAVVKVSLDANFVQSGPPLFVRCVLFHALLPFAGAVLEHRLYVVFCFPSLLARYNAT